MSGESLVAPLLAPPPVASQQTLLPKVQLSHFGQDIAFTETQVGVTGIPVTKAGSGYTTAPKITIAPPAAGGGARRVA